MRIEASSSSCSDVVPASFTALVERIKTAPNTSQFVEELEKARSLQAVLAKTELSRWADVLDRCDDVLAATTTVENYKMRVDFCAESKKSTMAILRFTSLLFECTSTRRIYASTDRLLALLESSDLAIVADVLRLLQTIGKRSKFLPTRLPPIDQTHLVEKLTSIAQCWGGRLRSVKMGDCLAEDNTIPNVFPFSYNDGKGHIASLDQRPDEEEPLLAIVGRICGDMDREHRYTVLSRLRMLRLFHVPEHRMQCLVIRLLSISTLIYCRCQPDETQINALVYPGFIEETAALLRIPLSRHILVDVIQAEALRTLTSVVSLEKAPKVAEILDALGANSYHGFIGVFTRMLVDDIKNNQLGAPGKPSVALGTALFSFIYHISNIESGGEKLMSCGLAATLLTLIEHKELSLDLISFATRCSRIIDTFTTLDVSAFRTLRGMNMFVERLVHEVNECRKEQPFVIDTSGDVDDETYKFIAVRTPVVDKRCHQLRTGLIKGLLTFIKRVINVPEMQDSVRTIMEGALPDALMHIISNAEYYSDSIYHHTLQLITNFIYQEPTQLTQLQKRHVPFVMLQSMLRKELPNSRDVIGQLGNVFTALCLNEQGLRQFKSYRPFNHVFKIVMSIKFLATLKKKRSEMHDAATTIGAALDDLLRHQPTLKPLMLDAVLEALDTLNDCAKEPPPNTKIVMALSKVASKAAYQNFSSGSGGNSPMAEQAPQEEEMVFSPRDDDSEDDDEADLSMDEVSTVRPPTVDKMGLEMDCPSEQNDGSRVLPLGDYLLIFTKIFEAVVTQAQASDLIEGFVERDGIEKLLALSQVRPISNDLASSNFGQSVAAIVQFVLQHKPAGERLMGALDKLFQEHAAVLPKADDCSGGSYLAKIEPAVLSEALSFINGTLPILVSLSKIPYGGSQYSSERRGRVTEAWLTPIGKSFHKCLRRTARFLAWDATLIKVIEDTKIPASTQTDPVELEELDQMAKESNGASTAVVSVAVDAPKQQSAWEGAGIEKSVVEYWQENKNLADALLKANKQLAEFVTLISRSCYAPVRRNRRYEYATYNHPKSTSKMADEVFTVIYADLKYVPNWGINSPMEFGRLSEVLSQLSGVLFDERRQPYHAMLDKFYSSGCHQAFCDILTEKLAPALEGPTCPQLDAAYSDWFKLAARLANRNKMMHTVYRQTAGNNVFDPEKYCRLVHSDFFRVLSCLFAKLSGDSVQLKNYMGLCEEAIAVYKEVAESLVPTPEEDKSAPPPANPIPEERILSLMEMGFDRDEVILALTATNSVGDATEFLIARQPPPEAMVRPVVPLPNADDFVDHEAMLVAMEAMDQGIEERPAPEEGDGRLSAGSDENAVAIAAPPVTPAQSISPAPEGIAAPIITPLKELHIDKDVSISQACIELMPLCKRLLEFGSELVFSCADLFISVIGSLDDIWKKNELINTIMLGEIIDMIKKLLAQTSGPEEELATVLSTRIHFACLLFEHVAEDYLQMCENQPMVSTMLMLMSYVYTHFDFDPYMHEKLLPPTVLWLDLYDKCCRALKRRQLVLNLVPQQNLKWSYLGDDSEVTRYGSRASKKWIAYQPHCQEKINKAFFAGKPKVSIKKRDRDVVLDFALLSEKENDIHKHSLNVELPEMENIAVSAKDILDSERFSVWTDAQRSDLLVQVVRLLHKGLIHHTAAHSLLSFVARLTRDSACAEQFLRDGGVAAVIKLRSSSTPCSSSLTSLILRQCVDCDEFTRAIFEKSVRQCTSVNSAPLEFLGIADSRPKEWHDTMNKLTPLAIRQPEVFVDVIDKNVKMANGTGNQQENMIAQYIGKPTRSTSENTSPMNAVVSLLLNEVLNGEWPNESELPLGHGRMLSRGALLNLLSELVKAYAVAASLVCEAKNDNQSILLSLLDRYIGHEDKETLRSLKVLIAVLSTCNHSPKAQESLVSDIKSCLASICDAGSESTSICSKLSELCSLISHIADSPSPQNHPIRAGHAPTVNPILKLFHKKKVCNDLVRGITFLRFSNKDAMDTTSEILRTLETLMRNMNSTSQPANIPEHHHAGASMPRAVRGLLSLEELFNEQPHDDRRMEAIDNTFFRELARAGNEDVEALERNLADLRHQLADDAAVHVDQDEDAEDSENSMSDEEPAEQDSADEEDEEEMGDHGGVAANDEDEEHNGDSVGEDDDHNEDAAMDMGDTEEEEVPENNEEETEEDDDDDDDDDGDDDDGEDYENDHPYDEDRDDPMDEFYGMDRPALIMDGLMDDWDMFPAALGSSRHTRRQNNTNTTHPLLVRPHHIIDAPHSQHVFTVPFDYHHIVGGGPLALTRQNAIRRLGGSSRSRPLEPRRMIFDRLFDIHDGRHIHTGISANREAEDQRLRASIPSALERITEGSDLLEPISIRFLGVILNAIVTVNAEKALKAEKAQRAEKTLLKRKDEEGAAAAAGSSNAAETATVVAPPQPEIARAAWEGSAAPGPAGPEEEEEQRDEAMDVTEQNAIREDASDAPPISSAATVASSLPEDEDQNTNDSFPMQMDDNSSPADSTAPAPLDEVVPMEVEQAPEPSAEPSAESVAAEQQPLAEEAAQEPATEAPVAAEAPVSAEEAAPAVNEIPEEFRAILGDIVIPEGVDPAFLAALPEDMRAEVIRDHERQQRAQRAAASVPAVAPAVADGAAPAVPVVEPLDQDFLNALPPELQEEILAQHERAVREAEEAIRRANEPAPPPQPEMDGAAVIASLPPRERQQVLAEMDDTDLQRLPQAMQDEARRARANIRDMMEPMIQRNVMRIHNLYVRNNGGGVAAIRHGGFGGGGRGPAVAQGEGRVGLAAGRTQTASTQAVQLVDRESIIILCGLFLLDNRLTIARLQKVIRLICTHAASCDFVIWCLQGFLNKASEGTIDDEEIVSVCPEWLDSISVPGGGHNERSVKISKGAGKVFVHPVVSGNLCRNALDALHALARAFPGHFVPTALRSEQLECKQWPQRDSFWQLLQNPSGKALGKEPVDSRPVAEQFATSPLAHLVQYFNKPRFFDIPGLQDKLFKVIHAIVQTLPDDTITRLGLTAESTPLEEEVKILVSVLSKGTCGTDGFLDGRTVLMELMRVLSPEISRIVYDNICESIVNIGLTLQPQIENLMAEMGEVSENGDDVQQPSTSSGKGRITSARLAGDSVVVDGDASAKMKMSMYVCREMRLPAMMALTDKSGAQYTLLSSLQTLTKLRDTMRSRKIKKHEEAKKKAAEAEALQKAKAEALQKAKTSDSEAIETAKAKAAALLGAFAAAHAEGQQTPAAEGTQTSGEAVAAQPATSEQPQSSGAAQASAEQPSSSTSEAPKEIEVAPIVVPPLDLINVEVPESRLSQRLSQLEGLWNVVSQCLLRLGKASDPHAVLALHPAAEAFFLVHSVPKSSTTDHEHPDNVRMIEFAEKHREVLNQVLRQNNQALSSGGPFTFLTQFPKLLDFDVKRKFFRKELTRIDGEQGYRRADVNVQVRRTHLFSDSFRELYRLRPAEWKKRFYIVFQGEEGQDAGGLLREWFSVITREIFNPNYALFITAPGDMVTYMINKASYINPEHLDYFKFVGRLIAKAIYDNKLLDCYFTRAFYKHILNVPVRYQDIESEDPAFFNSLEFLLNNPINDLGLDLTFSLEVEEFGVRSIRDLKPDGRKIEVNDDNKVEYVNLVCQMKMTGSIQKQLDAFLQGFYEVIPKSLISMFNEQELELLISGLPDVDIDDLANNTEYKSYTKTSPQIQWFWRALRSFEAEDRAKFLQFVTGTSKVPLQGFASLEGMNGVQKFSIHMDSRGGDRLPAAHTCFNQLDLPQYESYEKLRDAVLIAIRECTEGFGFA